MPDANGCQTPNEIETSYIIRDAIIREYDKWVRKHGTELARIGLRKALRHVLEDENRGAIGRHFWEGR